MSNVRLYYIKLHSKCLVLFLHHYFFCESQALGNKIITGTHLLYDQLHKMVKHIVLSKVTKIIFYLFPIGDKYKRLHGEALF